MIDTVHPSAILLLPVFITAPEQTDWLFNVVILVLLATATTQGIKGNFFDYLDAALKFVLPTEEDKAIRAKLARVDVGPGKSFDLFGT
ncbi:hypothetical protein G3A39_38180 [Paraburkholderia aspalathi]|nr:hypothetical protein [Paraburkholderia aspalathi]